MKRVCLLSLEQAAVIVSQASNVLYWNHSGHSDPRFSFEGTLVPISNDPPADQPELALCPRLQTITAAAQTLTPAIGRAINELLYEVSSSDEISVNPSRLGDSAPGWVHITIKPQGEFSYFEGFVDPKAGERPLQGVLTWPCRD